MNQSCYDYSVNEKKKTVTCRYVSDDGEWFATAKCREGDEFDKETGMVLSKKLALLKAQESRLKRLKNITGDLNNINADLEELYEIADSIEKAKSRYLRLRDSINTLKIELRSF